MPMIIASCERCAQQWIVPDATDADLLEGSCLECQEDSDSEKPLRFYELSLPELPKSWLTT